MLKKLAKNIYGLIIYILDQIILFSGVSLKNRTLLIVRLDAIGDFILWLDSAKEFRKLYPDKKITLLANIVWSEMAKEMPFWDEVWSLDRNRFYRDFFYRWNTLHKVRKSGFEIVIHPSYSRDFLYGDSIVRASGSKQRIGSTGDFSNINPWIKRLSDRWYTKLIPADSKPIMELKRNAEFFRGITYKNFVASCPSLSPISSARRSESEDAYYILFPGAGRSKKRWSLTSFAKLADRIYLTSGWKGLICGGPGEGTLGEKLTHLTNAPLKNLIGKTSLIGLTELIHKSKLLISNDTCAIHIAAAVGTPSICLLGGGHYGRFLPYDVESDSNNQLPIVVIYQMDCFGCNWKCRYKIKEGEAVPCIQNISVDVVWTATKSLLDVRSSMD